MGLPPIEHDPDDRIKLIDVWPGDWTWNSDFGCWSAPLPNWESPEQGDEYPTYLAMVSEHEWMTEIGFEDIDTGDEDKSIGFILRSRPRSWSAMNHMIVSAKNNYECAKKLRPYIENVVEAVKGMRRVAKKLGCGGP